MLNKAASMPSKRYQKVIKNNVYKICLNAAQDNCVWHRGGVTKFSYTVTLTISKVKRYCDVCKLCIRCVLGIVTKMEN